mgnify:CR=1 FL=1
MKLSMNKINMIQDAAFQFSLTDKISLLFPVFLYHNRYNEINAVDIAETFGSPMNDTRALLVATSKNRIKGRPIICVHLHRRCLMRIVKKYMDMIHDICKKNHIKLMLLKVPGAKEWNQSKKEAVELYAKERHLPYLDLNTNMEKNIDWRRGYE